MGTVYGEQEKRIVRSRAEAEALQADWAGAAPLPLVQTSLAATEIRDAEYLVTTCRDLNLAPREAAKFLIRTYRKTDAPPMSDAVTQFIAEKVAGRRNHDHIGKLAKALRGLIKSVGHEDLSLLSVLQVETFLKAVTSELDLQATAYNHYRNNIHSFLLWCQKRWWVERVVTQPIIELPVEKGEPDALPASTAVRLLRFIENENPEWALFYSLATIVGVRPDGEMERMHKELEENKPVFTETGFTVIGKGKNGNFRRRFIRWEVVPMFHAWFRAYPAQKRLFPTNPTACRNFMSSMRDRFGIGHDMLRHTAATAMRASGMGYGDIADILGNSEAILRKSYISPRWSKEDAETFFSTFPRPANSAQGKVA